MELWRKMKEIMTSGKKTGEILDIIEKLCPEFAQEGCVDMRKREV